MRKGNIDKFYVGVLNFPFKMGKIFWLNNDNKYKEKRDLYYDTIVNGAIDLRSQNGGDEIELDRHIHTVKLYTLFYKVDDVHYLCLHNKKYYGDSEDYYSNLEKLTDVLPKIDIIYENDLSFSEALKLFKQLFKYENSKICQPSKTLFGIENFYIGDISLCTDYYVVEENPFDSKYYFMNLPKHLILYRNDHLYRASGFTRKDKNNREYSFSNYHSLFIKTPNDKYYSLNDYGFYNLSNQDRFNTEVTIEKPMVNELEENNIAYPKEVTIQKVLKLQKKLYDWKK